MPAAPKAIGPRAKAFPTSTSRWDRRRRTSRRRSRSRVEDQDELAALSQQRASAAQERGFFAAEITPVTLSNGTVVDKDDCPRAGTTAEKLGALKPVFSETGTVTAGNACPLNDGAAAVLVMSEEKAKALGLKPIARIVSSGVTGLNPEIMGMGPVAASQQALARAGLTMKDIDLVEINEAFAAQVVPSARAARHPVREAQRERRRDRARPSVRHDRRAHHDDAASTASRSAAVATVSRRCASVVARAWP